MFYNQSDQTPHSVCLAPLQTIGCLPNFQQLVCDGHILHLQGRTGNDGPFAVSRMEEAFGAILHRIDGGRSYKLEMVLQVS